jgi:2-keto-4-pentenoate hydratase/2-oxohepta-3-ene-1,7-dioic acid hydratase in catechol pathway
MRLIRLPDGGGRVAIVTPQGSVPIPLILGIGLNYAEHAREQGKGLPERPVVFIKAPFAAALHGEDIVIPRICQDRPQVDYEAELGVVVGRRRDGHPVRDVSRDEALSCVWGYVCANDVSARWWQKEGSGGQFCRGKSFDTFCPLGPHVAAPVEVGDPNSLRILCRVNGEVVQEASTRDMIFDVATLIAELSRGMTLPPGTVILTGTPSGVGMSRNPARFLRSGDEVEVEIERVGLIRNRVREE